MPLTADEIDALDIEPAAPRQRLSAQEIDALDLTKLRSEEPSRGGYLTEIAHGLTDWVPASVKTASTIGAGSLMPPGIKLAMDATLRRLGADVPPPESRPLYRAGEWMEKKLEDAYPSVPQGERHIGHDVARGVGQVVSMVGPALGAKAAGLGIRGAAAIATGLGSGLEFDDAFNRARQRGDDPDTALAKALGYTTASAMIENRLGAGRILKKYFPDPVEAAKKLSAWGIGKATAVSLAVGFGEEGAQRFTQNLIVEGKPSLEGVVEEGAPGGIVQAIAELPANLLRGRGGRVRSSLPRPPATPPEESEQEKLAKQTIAIEPAEVRQQTPPATVLASDTPDPAVIGRDIGFEFNPTTQIGAIRTEGLTPEQQSQLESTMPKQWEFTDRRPDSPTAGLTFYVPEGSTRETIERRLQEKIAEQKPSANAPAIPTGGDERIAFETTEQLVARTSIGTERDAAFSERAAALKRVALSLREGDTVIDEDGNRRTVQDVSKDGTLWLSKEGAVGTEKTGTEARLTVFDTIERQAVTPSENAQQGPAPVAGVPAPVSGGTPPATAAPVPEPDKSSTALDASQFLPVELKVSKIKLSKDVPNFKANADPKTGVVPGEELKATKFERTGTAPIVVWERLNGDLEVITGRHKLDLARRLREKTIPAQIVREADGWNQRRAAQLDAEANIRDGQGAVADYANYFKNSDVSAEAATARGLLSRVKGRSGFSLGRLATDELYDLYANDRIGEAEAVAIAEAAPNDAALQSIGVRQALKGHKADELISEIEAAKVLTATVKPDQMDLWGQDDSAILAMEQLAVNARTRQREIQEQISAISGATKNPTVARQLGVDVKDEAQVKAKLVELYAQRARWKKWGSDPEIVRELQPPSPSIQGWNQIESSERQTSTPEEVQAAIDGENNFGFRVNIVSLADAQKMISEQSGGRIQLPATVGGFFHDGQIWLVHDGLLNNPETIRQTFREEAAHGLLRTPQGATLLRNILAEGKLQITEADRDAIRGIAEAYESFSDENLLHEFIAKSAREDRPWWKQAVDAIRAFLSRFGLQLSNEETARLLLKNMQAQAQSSVDAEVTAIVAGEADIPLAAAPRNSIAALDRQINTLREKQSFQGLNAQESQRLRDLETQRGQMDLPGTEGALEPRFQLQGESRREVAPTQRPKQSDQFDLPLSVEPQPDGGPEVIRVPVQIAGSGPEEYTILGNDMLTAEMIARGEARAVDLFQELRLPGHPDARVHGQRQRGSTDTNVVFRVDPGAAFPGGYETEGESLLETFIREATQQNNPGGDAAYVVALGNAITKNFRLGNLNGVFSQDLIDRLIQATVSDRSFKAQLLRAATGLGEDISSIGRNLDFYLRRLMGDAFGGTEVREVIQRVLINFRSWFTDAELNNFADAPASAEARQQLETMVSRLIALNVRDEGSRLYRRAQAALKPKFAKTLARLEADDRVQRAFEEILQQAEAQGFKPKKAVGKKKLSALESLLLMVSPETAVKLDAMIQKAVRDGELNAGVNYALAQATAQGGDAAAQELQGRFDAGEEPTQEQTEAGLTNPEYAHWQAIRDNLLNYEPITIKHAQDVLREDFKGTIFGEPVQRPADTRIDIANLAKAPDDEVARVLQNFLQNVEANVDLSGASDETRLRVAGLITGQFEDQLQKARNRIIQNFLVPPQRMPAATPQERLSQLLNARLARDPRFNSEPVRKLVQRVTQRFVDATIFDDLATQERDAKAAWIETTGTEVVDSIPELAGSEATDPFRLFAEQVVFNELATKLQAAESRLVRRILDGPDVKLGTEPSDPAKVVERLNKDRQRLEGAAHAGLLDASMIDAIAQKSVTQKLLPTLNQMIQQALNTPIAREEDIFRNFADALVHDLGIDPALADKARALMEKAYALKFRKAREMALQRAIDAASPKELRTLKGRKAVWQIVERVVHAGGMDDGSVLAALAKYHKWNPLTDNLRARFKALVEAEDKLRELTPAERDKAGNDPLLLERAQRDKQAATEGDRVKIKKEMEALWSHLTRPMNLLTREGRSNIGAATMEFSAANLLTRTGFPFRQLQDILTQGVLHTPTRALAPVIQRYLDDRQRGLPTELWSDLNKSLWSAYRTWFSKWRESLASTVLALKGTQDARNVERLLSGIAAFDRLDLYATQLSEEGKHAQAFMARLIGLVKIGYRIAQAFDNLHGTPAEFQEMRQQAVDKLISNGQPYAAAHLRADELMGAAKAEWLDALTTARQIRENAGLPTGGSDVRGAAANIVKARAYQRMRESGLPADDFEEHGRMLRNTIGWNERETGGVGGVVAGAFREARGLSERVGFPVSIVGSIFNFGNAIGITINRVLSFTPLGFFPSAFGVNKEAIAGGIDAVHGSPWYRTRTDRTQRKIEATIGTGLGALAFALPLLGVIVVRSKWPRDKEERELWEKEGHRPGTIEIPVEGGFIAISMTSGPLVFLRPYLAASGALVELFKEKDKAQEKLNQQAALMGTTPGKVKPVDAADVIGVVAQAAQAALIGGRTASGLIGAFTDYGIPNVKKIGANIVAPYIPGLPAFQELSRMAGTRIDAKMASFFDFLVPLPTSQAAAVNMLGDKVGTENDIQRVIQTLTGGTYPFVATGEAQEATGYRTLFETGYRPPSINSNRGYDINGETRPLNDAELLKYTKLRGQYFKEELTNLPPGSTKEAAKNAFETANTRALSEVGVYAQPRASSPRAVTPIVTSAPRASRSGRIRSSLGSGRSGRTRLTSMKVPKLKRGRVRGSMRRRGRIRTSSRRVRRPRIYA